MQIEVPKKQLFSRFFLLLALGNSHGHGDGGADHGVVAHRKTPIFAVLLLNNNVFSRNKLLKISKYHFY
mgnify:CR=1 FL=1